MQPVQITLSAVRKVRVLMREAGDLDLMLRAYVTGGGCQGLQYGFALEACREDDDWHMWAGYEAHDQAKTVAFLSMLCECVDRMRPQVQMSGAILAHIGVVIDPISLPYLQDATIDYVIDGHGERFMIHNPNAKTTCGCDRSFTAA